MSRGKPCNPTESEHKSTNHHHSERIIKRSSLKLSSKIANKHNAKFVENLYPNINKLIFFLTEIIGIKELKQKIKSHIDPSYGPKLYNQIMHFFHNALIWLPTSKENMPTISAVKESITMLLQEFLRSKFGKALYDRRSNILTNSYYKANRKHDGSQKYIPLLNVDDVVVQSSNDSVNYLLSSKQMQILHQLIGDDIMYHFLKYATIFIPVPLKSNQFWQLLGQPVTDRLWNQKRNSSAMIKEKKNKKRKINNKGKKKQKGYLVLSEYKQRKQEKQKNANKMQKNHQPSKEKECKEDDVEMIDFGKLNIAKINSSKCVLCGVNNATVDHFKGKKHKNKLKLLARTPTSFPIKRRICVNKTCNSLNAWNQHIATKKHLHTLKTLSAYSSLQTDSNGIDDTKKPKKSKNKPKTKSKKRKNKKKQKRKNQIKRIEQIFCSLSPSSSPSASPKVSLLGKRKASAMNMLNSRKKFRRLNTDSTCMFAVLSQAVCG